MINVRVGGVPEHFNLAWHLAIEEGAFSRNNIAIQWVDVPGGTGTMCKALKNDEFDIAIALTEGIIKDIVAGNPSKIIQFYVNSPLRWGIFVNAKSTIKSIKEIEGKKYAISRFGSGSHLMAFVNASNHALKIGKEDFVIVDTIDGARKALAEDSAQIFMWEKFMTKPFVDNGEFRMIGECNTPWPCFVIAASDKFILENENALNVILDVINKSCSDLKNNPKAPDLIVERYGIKKEDAEQWFKELEYAYHPDIPEAELRLILWRLKEFGIIESVPELTTIVYGNNLELSGSVLPESH
ncbi:ABC transporter substrate-binding protein [Sphingobacteriaceae bacterium]|nr:ABC transporter substrate-binding protein [Sphingobacteriaceae bacterium]